MKKVMTTILLLLLLTNITLTQENNSINKNKEQLQNISKTIKEDINNTKTTIKNKAEEKITQNITLPTYAKLLLGTKKEEVPIQTIILTIALIALIMMILFIISIELTKEITVRITLTILLTLIAGTTGIYEKAAETILRIINQITLLQKLGPFNIILLILVAGILIWIAIKIEKRQKRLQELEERRAGARNLAQAISDNNYRSGWQKMYNRLRFRKK